MHIVGSEESKKQRQVYMWIIVAFIIDFVLFLAAGQDMALDFLGGYLIELSLSVDNLFVFMSIFTAFSVPEKLRHRVLRYGIFGAAVLRMIFILFGAAMVSRFAWILYLFGAVLIGNGMKMLLTHGEEKKNIQTAWGMRLVRRFLPVTKEFCGARFFVRRAEEGKDGKKRRFATPLFVVLVVIELSDIIFAIDSVPAVFSVTTNPWIVYTSNLLAILGLRQMYFVLEKLAERFVYVKYGIAVVLMFTGVKLLGELFSLAIPIAGSIFFIVAALSVSMAASMFATKKGNV